MSNNKFATLWVRLLTGIVFVGVILTALFVGSVPLMWSVLGLFVTVGLYEYQTITGTNRYGFILMIVHALFGGYLFFAASLLLIPSALWSSVESGLIMALYVFYALFYAVGEMFRTRSHPLEEVAKAFWGHIYIALPFSLLMVLFMSRDPGYLLVFPIFILVWVNDTGAYLTGSMIGRHKLIERISPKKTIEGTIGGILLSVLAGLGFYYMDYGVMSLGHWALFGLLISVAATLGDLYESFLKREYGVKDSGWILPGHGGILDRVDSLLLVSVVAYFFYLFIGAI